MLAGTFDHAAAGSQYRRAADDNHIYFWLRVSAGRHAGIYECAVNLASAHSDSLHSPVLYCEREEVVAPGALPAEGFHPEVKRSYSALGLRDQDFGPLPQAPFGPSLLAHAKSCIRMAAYGVTYNNGEGLHDIHLNSHESPASIHRDRLDEDGQPTQDGALVFYCPTPEETILARWIFSKFPTQQLGGLRAGLRRNEALSAERAGSRERSDAAVEELRSSPESGGGLPQPLTTGPV
jgi:hypothetical protein